jgi:carboxyl-terminal processing protease
MKRNWITTLICLTVAIIFFAAGFLTNNFINVFNPKYEIQFSQDVSRENIINFNRVKSLLMNSYYLDINEDVLLEGAINGMVEAVEDPYSVYYTPEMMNDFMEQQTGSYVGIGVTVFMDNDGLATVSDVFSNSPAKSSGMRNGDKIVLVNGEDVTALNDLNIIVGKIKGESETQVAITVYRPEIKDYIELDLVRKLINIDYIASRMIGDNIGYIQLRLFDEDITKDFVTHANQLLQQGAKGLILDLRNNPGGDYGQVVRMADIIVPEGLIVYIEDRHGNRDEEKSDPNELNVPLTVLINEYSASASEILSAAIKHYDKGTLIGKTTFGKGLVQSIIQLEGGAGLKVTTARYFTPSGVYIHGIGVTPDIEIENDEKYQYYSIDEIPEGEDKQLQRAIEEVSRLMSEVNK